MPTTPAKARKMIQGGVAKGCWSKLCTFYVQMLRPVGTAIQPLVAAHDPGATYEGWAIVGTKEVPLLGETVNPQKVADKLTTRRQLRRGRRYRNCRQRPTRFNHRRRKPGWVAPCQRAKVELRERVAGELSRVYPIRVWVCEDVRIDGNQLISPRGKGRRSWKGQCFSTAMAGKARWYAFLAARGALVLRQGWQTQDARKTYGLPKTRDKGAHTPAAHATDALALAVAQVGLVCVPVWSQTPFVVWRRFEFARRAFHRQQFQKGGSRPVFGGTTNGGFWRKGDDVEAEIAGRVYRGWVCGLPTSTTPKVGVQTAEGVRIGQFSPKKVRLLARSRGLSWQISAGAALPPHA
jgi:hypothetical protein